MQHPSSILKELATARQHVTRCRQLVRRQIEIVRLCQHRHRDELDSVNLLRELREALAIGRHHMHVVAQELGRNNWFGRRRR
ncbi:hypothetical protein [Cupriavidus sp. U2]|uniref:hypothetical protein n=1 Tax=Cupriavidus sp. U2 TaxID=2920269 RepID=UPI00129E948A|nr:hypothetical protein [Cupriavidus sp. U2]